MLKRLYISNFALIGEMNVSFSEGLTVITGETGAGKSIFLEAFALALGNRADSGNLRDKNKKCIVEAEFEIENKELKAILEANDLDEDTNIVLRREISADGKSRSLLNDAVVNLNILKLVAEKAIDIHSQHQTLLLNESSFQLALLDAFANTNLKFEKYKTEYKSLSLLKQKLNGLIESEIQAKKELDYFQFLFNEFDDIIIEAGQLEKLESESSGIENAEYIKSNLLNAANLINGGEMNLLSNLVQVRQNLQSLSKFGNKYQLFYERANSLYIELKDLADEFEHAESEVLFDKERLEEINSQMDKLNRLMKKHHVKTETELIEIKNQIEQKLIGINSLENDIQKLKKEVELKETDCLKQAKDISKLRLASIPVIEKTVKEMLAGLMMTNATFKIELTYKNELSYNGLDSIKFMFSANKGTDLNELSKVASGGELSRLMLTLKSLLAAKKKLPTIIFDEIDTGVSGDVANKIGDILLQMGSHMQVITITHLPQMASKGSNHYYVYKKDDNEKTNSLIKELKGEERINEIAKMLSAGKLTQSAIVNARELLSLN